jgi:hypothetical protein
MCASSKLLHAAWLQLLKEQPSPAWLVAAAADAAHAANSQLQAKSIAVVGWLLKSLPEAQLAEHPSTLAGLLAIPHMPEELAKELCRFGVKVPYKEIVRSSPQAQVSSNSQCLLQLPAHPMSHPSSCASRLCM